MIFKETINNAVKYSKATEIDISFTRNEDMLQLQVIDNGIGFNPDVATKGNGLMNMRSRASAMQAEFSINSIKNTGTTILLQKHIT